MKKGKVEKGLTSTNPARIYCDGVFDLFHYGHAKVLEQAKKLKPHVYLLVGVCSDKLTNEKKGKTVLTEGERYQSVRHCRWVDEVIEDAPWVIDEAFLKKHRIDYVAHDDLPYTAEETPDIYKFVKDSGRFIATQRTDGISTSDIISRIVRDYDEYLRRNLERGMSPKELNISVFKEGQLKMQKTVDDFKTKLINRIKNGQSNILKNWENSADEFRSALDYWEGKSQELVGDFLKIFNRKRRLISDSLVQQEIESEHLPPSSKRSKHR